MTKAVRQLASRALGEKPILTLDGGSADGGERRFRAKPCAHKGRGQFLGKRSSFARRPFQARREQLGSSILHAGCFRRQASICSRPEPLLSLVNRPGGSGTSATCGADRYRCARLGERSVVRDAEWYRDSMRRVFTTQTRGSAAASLGMALPPTPVTITTSQRTRSTR
jgi:hypothetical protein